MPPFLFLFSGAALIFRPPCLAMTANTSPRSRRAREFCWERSALLIRGRGECRMPDAPAASCAHIGRSTRCARRFVRRDGIIRSRSTRWSCCPIICTRSGRCRRRRGFCHTLAADQIGVFAQPRNRGTDFEQPRRQGRTRHLARKRGEVQYKARFNIRGRISSLQPGWVELFANPIIIKSLRPLPLGRRGRCRRRCRRAVAGAEQQAGRVAVEIVHRAADIAQGAAAIGHQQSPIACRNPRPVRGSISPSKTIRRPPCRRPAC